MDIDKDLLTLLSRQWLKIVLQYLTDSEDFSLNQTDLRIKGQIISSNASKYIAILEKNGILTARKGKDGREVYYKPNRAKVTILLQVIKLLYEDMPNAHD